MDAPRMLQILSKSLCCLIFVLSVGCSPSGDGRPFLNEQFDISFDHIVRSEMDGAFDSTIIYARLKGDALNPLLKAFSLKTVSRLSYKDDSPEWWSGSMVEGTHREADEVIDLHSNLNYLSLTLSQDGFVYLHYLGID